MDSDQLGEGLRDSQFGLDDWDPLALEPSSGWPPVEPPEPPRDPPRPTPSPRADPPMPKAVDFAGIGLLVAFTGLFTLAATAGASGGEWLVLFITLAFTILYLGFFMLGSLWMQQHRH